MSTLLPSIDRGESDTLSARFAGVVIGIVTNNQDPEGWGRVKVKFPWLSDHDESAWARIAAPVAGEERGFYWLPEVDDEVLVAFERGDLRFPYVLGGLWNGRDLPPLSNKERKNDVRLIKSRSGHTIRLTDEGGKEKIEIEDGSGKNKLVIDAASNTISIKADQDIALSAPQGQIKLSAQTVVIEAKSALEIKSASAKIETQESLDLTANGQANLKGAVVNIN